jgi:hypothetical protein
MKRAKEIEPAASISWRIGPGRSVWEFGIVPFCYSAGRVFT